MNDNCDVQALVEIANVLTPERLDRLNGADFEWLIARLEWERKRREMAAFWVGEFCRWIRYEINLTSKSRPLKSDAGSPA